MMTGLSLASVDHVLGITGLTPGGLGIWVFGIAQFVFLVAWWVRGMADRRRATNEGVTAESKASNAQFDRLEKEILRLTEKVEKQDKVIQRQADRIEVVEKGLRDCEDRHAAAIAENLKLRAINDGQGEIRGQLQRIVSADRIDRLAEGKI
jgi:hypothetical protein